MPIFRKKISSFKDVSEYQLCCGCGLCSYLYPQHIKMVDSVNFGRRPFFDEQENCNYVEGLQYCPGIRLDRKFDENDMLAAISSLFTEWGPILKVYEGHAADKEIRFKGSSGGAISALSLFCIEQDGCEGALHVKADPDKPWLNTASMSYNKSDLLGGVGSRYSPASPCEKLSQVEQADGKVVVVGKPCDIAATYNVACDRQQLRTKIGVLIACFCAGTPSTKGTLKMLEDMQVTKEDLRELRYRGHGWPGMTTAVDKQGVPCEGELTYAQSWGEILQKFRQWRCYICPDHAGEFADIAVGDPWYKEVTEDDIGQSLILARTKRGMEIVERAIAAGYMDAVAVEPDILPRSQVNLELGRANLWGRLLTLKLMNAPHPIYRNFGLFQPWMSRLSIKEKVKSVLSTVKRIFVKKLKKKQDIYNSLK